MKSIENPQPQENLHALSREKSELRKALNELGAKKDEESEIVKTQREAHEEGLEEIKTKVSGLIEKSGGLKEAKRLVREDMETAPKAGFVDELSIFKEIGPVYADIADSAQKIEDATRVINHNFQQISLETDPYKRKVLERVVKAFEAKREAYEEIYSSASIQNPKAMRASELVEYKKGIHSEGHIAMTPSVRNYVEEIEKKMLTGDPMFLHGPTGTGKTSLGRLASEKLTGKTAEMVYCNQQTRESNIWGKTGVRGDGKGGSETFDILGPLARAIKEGKPIIFDEFNSLEEDQMRIIKGIFGYKPGDKVPITGNGMIPMAPGFQIICTANLKSEKHTDRKDLPDEIKREFEQNNMEIGYNPKHESYDIMLARLMNPNGSIDLSWHDINVTLPKFAEAMESIQNAYAGNLASGEAMDIGAVSASNIKSELKSFVMTQGSVEAILDQWRVEGKTGRRQKTFAEFIDERIKTALTFKAYSEEDRILAAKIFALKGFLKTVSPEDLGLPKDIFNGVKIKNERGGKDKAMELKEKSSKVAHITLSELTDLDPFNVREHPVDPLNEFGVGPENSGDDFSKSIQKKLAKIWGKEKKIDSVISAEYVYINPTTQKEERRENITLNLEKSLDEYIALYQDTGIDLPDDFREQVADIWQRNSEEIQKSMEENGFNDMVIAPANIPLSELAEKMKMENGNYTSSNFDAGGSFAGAQSTGVDKVRIILVHKTQNLKDRPELKATSGVKAQDVNIEESLSLEDYILLQRKYFKETGKHLDEDGWTWIPRTKSGSRFVNSCWNPVGGKLYVDAYDAGYSSSGLGCRPSRYFV